MVMKVASISTSYRAEAVGLIKVTDSQSNSAIFTLRRVENVPGTIELVSDGSVVETDNYALTVSFNRKSKLRDLQISVNGEDPYSVELMQPCMKNEGLLEYGVQFRSDQGISASKKIFLNTFGFARIEVLAFFEGEEDPEVLSTRDIPCLSKDDQVTENIEKMLSELLDSEDTHASRWMFSGGDRSESPYSIIDGSLQDNSPKSLSAMVHLIEKVLIIFSVHQEYFRTHGYSRIVSRKTKLPIRKIRRAGNYEQLWISKNLQTLSETTSENGIEYAGSYYLPTRVETGKRVKTFNSYENRLILGFLEEILRTTRVIRETLVKGMSSIRALEERLSMFSAENYAIPALSLVRAYSVREKSYLAQIESFIGKAQELLRLYSFFMKGVTPKYSRNPRRTKVFQELQPYSQIYDLISEWISFGDFSLAKEGLALHALRADKLYEYYVLYKILVWFESRGFVATDIKIGKYRPERHFRPETHVSTVYDFAYQQVKVRLYYQPVIRGKDIKSEEGITLRRLSSSSIWKPDYIIRITTADGRIKWHVIDAKYSNPLSLMKGYPYRGALATCIMKYRQDIGGEELSDIVTSVWLLAGKGYIQDPIFAERSGWAKKHYHLCRSGIGLLTPAVSHLDRYFAEICPIASRDDSNVDEKNIALQVSKTYLMKEDRNAAIQDDDLGTSTVPSTNSKRNPTRFLLKNQGRNGIKQGLDEETISLVNQLIESFNCDNRLFDSHWASREFGISHPLLRKRIPNDREGKNYRTIRLKGGVYTVFTNWLPHQKIKLNNYVEKLNRKNEDR